jgi:hypothetical protein
MIDFNHGAEMIKINDQLIPAEMLDADLHRRWSIAQTRKVPNEINNLLREIQNKMAAHLLLRNAPIRSVTQIGLMGGHDIKFKSLREAADALAERSKRQQGIREGVGHERAEGRE